MIAQTDSLKRKKNRWFGSGFGLAEGLSSLHWDGWGHDFFNPHPKTSKSGKPIQCAGK